MILSEATSLAFKMTKPLVDWRIAHGSDGKARGSEMGTTIRVAAIQMGSRDGQIEANLKHATLLVNDAAARGAKLILLPGVHADRLHIHQSHMGRSRTARRAHCSMASAELKEAGCMVGHEFSGG